MKENTMAAKNLLNQLLQSQPGLLKEVPATRTGGEDLADFMAGFIRKYSEHLEAQDQSPSRG